jgi:mannobiose 2-epimerase
MEAYEHDRDKEYLDRLVKLWEFIKINMIDKVNGEWYWSVDQQNIPVVTENKAGFWKCPYHNGRAMMELIERIDKMKSAS